MDCKHTNIDCGCKDTYLTTPPPCPTPEDCPDQQPCSEVFDAQCIVYTGADISCGQVVVVAQNTPVADALADIVEYFCTVDNGLVLENDLFCPESPVIAPAGTPVNEALELLTQYICTSLPITAVVAGPGIDVTENTVGNVTTYTVSTEYPPVKKYVYEGTLNDADDIIQISKATYASCIPSPLLCGAVTGSGSDLIISGYWFDAPNNVWRNFTHHDKSQTTVTTTGDIEITFDNFGYPITYPLSVRVVVMG